MEIEVEEEQAQQLSQLTKFNKTFHKLSSEFYEKLEQLEQLGCMVKDVEQGLVDFVHRFEGRDVFLCWRLSEENSHYWHERDSEFAGRKKIFNLR